MTRPSDRLVFDPNLPWDGGIPYNRLRARLEAVGRPGLGPENSSRDIKDAGFDIMSAKLSPADRAAWDDLRLTPRRLAIDFFAYPTPCDPESGSAETDVPPPIDPPDLSALLDVRVDLGPPAVRIDPGSTPRPALVDLEMVELDLGPIGLPQSRVTASTAAPKPRRKRRTR